MTAINGTVAEVNQALTDLYTDPTNFNSTLTDTSISDAGALNTINTKTIGTVDATAATSITGTAAELITIGDADDAGTILAYTNSAGDEAYAAVFSGIADLAQFNAIDTDTAGKLDFTDANAYLDLSANDASDINLANLSQADKLTKIDINNSESNTISNVSAVNLIGVTGGSTTLTIDGDTNDFISFTDSWTQTVNANGSGDTHYTYTSGSGTTYTIIDTDGGMSVI